MKLLFCGLLVLGIGIGVLAEERVKRQASYTFPGPRSDRSYRQAPSQAAAYAPEEDGRDTYQAPRRQFEAQPVQPQYAPAQQRAPPAPVYEQPRTAAPAPRQQSARRRASSASNRANKYGSAPQQSLNDPEEDEDTGPDALTLLLQDSQFSCDSKNDGYYADDSVNCQVFHYCVSGAKHSWMCPENTVFHQVHLNCVPDAQDICSQSQKFHFVNDYLYKPVDYEGPNNTARYSQRYYPDGYSVGDPISAPQEQSRRPAQSVQSYPQPAQAPRAHQRQSAPAPPPQPAYRAPPQSAPQSYRSQSRPASRPSRPVESYPAEVAQAYRGTPVEAPQVYRVSPQSQPAAEAEVYRAQQAPRQPTHQRRPSPQAYRGTPQQEPPASHSAYSSEESPYQPQPQPQARRQAAPVQHARPTAGYAPPRQHYRPTSGRSAAGYAPVYGSGPGSGVQYDEEYN